MSVNRLIKYSIWSEVFYFCENLIPKKFSTDEVNEVVYLEVDSMATLAWTPKRVLLPKPVPSPVTSCFTQKLR